MLLEKQQQIQFIDLKTNFSTELTFFLKDKLYFLDLNLAIGKALYLGTFSWNLIDKQIRVSKESICHEINVRTLKNSPSWIDSSSIIPCLLSYEFQPQILWRVFVQWLNHAIWSLVQLLKEFPSIQGHPHKERYIPKYGYPRASVVKCLWLPLFI